MKKFYPTLWHRMNSVKYESRPWISFGNCHDVERVAKAGSYEKMKKEADSIISKAVTNQESVKLAQLYLYLSGFNKGNTRIKGCRL